MGHPAKCLPNPAEGSYFVWNKQTKEANQPAKKQNQKPNQKSTLIHSTFFLYMAIGIKKIQFHTSALKKIIHSFNLINL